MMQQCDEKYHAIYLIMDVFPVEYWPTNNTMGLASKSWSDSGGKWNSWYKYRFSRGSNLDL